MLLIFFYITVFALAISKLSFFKDDTIAPRFFILVFLIKFFLSCVQKYLYDKYNFGGDSITLFNSGNYVFGFLKENPALYFKTIFGTLTETDLKQHFPSELLWSNDDFFYNDNQTIIRVNALLSIFSFGSYYIHALVFCFFSIIGFNGLYKFFSSFYSTKKMEIFTITFLIPSTLFWCSNISKEAWLIFCLGSFFYILSKVITEFSTARLFILCVFLISLIYIKVYFLLALLPALIAYLISKNAAKIKPVFIYIVTYLFAFTGLFTISGSDFLHYLQFKQHSFQYLAEWSHSNSLISIPEIGNSFTSLIINAPISLWNILSRPYLFEIKSTFWVPAAIENILIFVILLTGLLFFKWNKEKAAISLFCLYFSVSLLILIGLTTPVIGGLVRYKAPLLPFFIMFFLFHFNFEKFKLKFKTKNKLSLNKSN